MPKTIEAIQIGSYAPRDPATGEFMPSVPLYIEATERAQQSEAVLHREIAHIFAGKMRQYTEGCETVGDKTTADAFRSDVGRTTKSAAAQDKLRRKKEAIE